MELIHFPSRSKSYKHYIIGEMRVRAGDVRGRAGDARREGGRCKGVDSLLLPQRKLDIRKGRER